MDLKAVVSRVLTAAMVEMIPALCDKIVAAMQASVVLKEDKCCQTAGDVEVDAPMSVSEASRTDDEEYVDACEEFYSAPNSPIEEAPTTELDDAKENISTQVFVTSGKARKVRYTDEEDQRIITWVSEASKRGLSHSGQMLWTQAEAAAVRNRCTFV
jgi:hypothetical protein